LRTAFVGTQTALVASFRAGTARALVSLRGRKAREDISMRSVAQIPRPHINRTASTAGQLGSNTKGPIHPYSQKKQVHRVRTIQGEAFGNCRCTWAAPGA